MSSILTAIKLDTASSVSGGGTTGTHALITTSATQYAIVSLLTTGTCTVSLDGTHFGGSNTETYYVAPSTTLTITGQTVYSFSAVVFINS